MRDSARAFMAFGLIALVLILTPKYLEIIGSKPASTQKPNEERALAEELVAESSIIPENRPEARVTIAPDRRMEAENRQRWPERTVVIETDLYTAVISSSGGGSIKSFELKGHINRRTGGPVQLIDDGPGAISLELAYVNLEGDSVYLQENFEAIVFPRMDTIHLSDGTVSMEFRRTFPSGATVTKKLTFQSDSYIIPLEIAWRDPGLELGINNFEVRWPDGLPPAEGLLREDETYGKVYVYQGGKLEDQGSARKGLVPRQTLRGSTDWVALRNKYFAAALIADQDQPAIFGALSAVSRPWTKDGDNNGGNNGNLTRYSMALGYDAGNPVKLSLYLGPLSYFIITDLKVDLERIMNLGFSLIRPISKMVLYSLVYLHEVIPNYGVVLILFAVAIRVVTNPLTKKSFTSTQKMQLVQPRVKELQEKYKGNAQKLNQEMMALWKREGVNPLGGCLPILIQMPLLWALFIVFRTTIELRGQPFVWWITDLSAPDVIFNLPFSLPLYGQGVTVLALIMGVTMFLQQKLSGAGSNPQQKPMMYMMSIFFFLIFNQFPSGLNLYYAFSNFLAIIQQRAIRKNLAAPIAAPATTKG